MLYCGERCNCSARIFYEGLEWLSTHERKEHAEKKAFEHYFVQLQRIPFAESPEAALEELKATYMSQTRKTDSA